MAAALSPKAFSIFSDGIKGLNSPLLIELVLSLSKIKPMQAMNCNQ